ncbi:hypothetical protein GCM10009801_23750 [Streptomyces albiaxialis]|uniref:Integral membrane protein n=2 Tax=Streptomyces albiaxialis TaxID=329523 RepID=A0ABN2VT48_9ACTN
MYGTSSGGPPSPAGAGAAPSTARETVDGRGPLAMLRAVSALACLGTLVQGLLAGMLLNGDVDSIDPHGANAYVFEALVFLQVVAAFLLWRRNRGLTWPLKATVGILVATFAQTGLGLEGSLAAHVTLGVALCAMETVLAMRVFALRVGSPS